ncbi:hypothetical protein [Streptomyces sp. MN6]
MLEELATYLLWFFTEDRAERRHCKRAARAGRRRWWAPWTRHPHPTTPHTSNR